MLCTLRFSLYITIMEKRFILGFALLFAIALSLFFLRNYGTPVPLERVIAERLARKFNLSPSDLSVVITQAEGVYARGFVQGAYSGVFWATKEDEHWDVPFIGEEPAYCQELESYRFPASMLEDCVQQ